MMVDVWGTSLLKVFVIVFYFSLKAIHRALRMNNPPLTQNSVVKPSRAIRLEPPMAPRKYPKNKQD